jgi:uncharacterized protein YkwD
MRIVLLLGLLLAAVLLAAAPAHALDLNGFRAQHHRPPLRVSSLLVGRAQEQADAMAGRRRIDHKDYRKRVAVAATTSAENVLVGCADEDCAIRGWARSAGHRRNMLRGDVSAYGIAYATGKNGRKYWALELGGE